MEECTGGYFSDDEFIVIDEFQIVSDDYPHEIEECIFIQHEDGSRNVVSCECEPDDCDVISECANYATLNCDLCEKQSNFSTTTDLLKG